MLYGNENLLRLPKIYVAILNKKNIRISYIFILIHISNISNVFNIWF